VQLEQIGDLLAAANAAAHAVAAYQQRGTGGLANAAAARAQRLAQACQSARTPGAALA
jgi:hypothetical protein